MKIFCDIYKCANKSQTYLYLKKELGTEEIPEGLSELLGELTRVMSLILDESTTLARVEPLDVIESLQEQGYFLQMPPGEYLKSQTPGQGFVQ